MAQPICAPKWNWDLAFSLWCGGLSDDEILAHPELRGLSKNVMVATRSRQGWQERKMALARLNADVGVDAAAKALAEELKREGIRHQQFILSELERERGVFSRRNRTHDGQLERMKILKEMDEIARRTSRLDEQKESNPVTQGFAILVQLQSAKPMENCISAIVPLPEHKKASAGILRSNNGMSEAIEAEEISPEEVIPEDRGRKEGQKPLPQVISFGAEPL